MADYLVQRSDQQSAANTNLFIGLQLQANDFMTSQPPFCICLGNDIWYLKQELLVTFA